MTVLSYAPSQMLANVFMRCGKCSLPYTWRGPICKCRTDDKIVAEIQFDTETER